MAAEFSHLSHQLIQAGAGQVIQPSFGAFAPYSISSLPSQQPAPASVRQKHDVSYQVSQPPMYFPPYHEEWVTHVDGVQEWC